MMKKDENKIIKLIAFGPLIIIPFFILTILLFIAQENKSNFEKTLDKVEIDLINSKNQAMKSKIDGMADLVHYQNLVTEKKLTEKVKDRVVTAHKIASKLYEEHKDSKTQKEIQSLIKKTLRPLLWNNGESFIWILNYKGEFQLAPQYLRHLEGSSILGFQDATGRYIIQEEIEIVKNDGEGFLWDTFTKPNDPTQKHYKQVAFVKAFGQYDWYLGSGEYIDTASKISTQEILKSIEKISLNKNDYIFIINSQGDILLNYAKPSIVGKNVLKGNNRHVKSVFNTVFNLTKTKGSSFLTYDWENPKTKQIEKKYSYVKRVPNSSWIIGSGFYESTINNIAAKHTESLYEDYNLRIDYIITFGIVIFLISLVVSFLISKYLSKTFYNYQKNINEKSDELQKSNENLEMRVKEEIQKNKQKEEQLFAQAKMAALGDMIANIAHQWRQPLSIISTIASGIKLKHEYNELKPKEISLQMNEIVEKTQHLSQTIDTFRNFLKEKKEFKEVVLQETIIDALKIIETSIKENSIIIEKNLCEETPFRLTTVANEISQVIINIVNNAMDAIVGRDIKSGWIKINLIQENNYVLICIEDNAGGIPEDIIVRVFEPYFTTKHQSQGTGLGLHMSYKIINESLKGDISVRNTEYGAKFFIKLPL